MPTNTPPEPAPRFAVVIAAATTSACVPAHFETSTAVTTDRQHRTRRQRSPRFRGAQHGSGLRARSCRSVGLRLDPVIPRQLRRTGRVAWNLQLLVGEGARARLFRRHAMARDTCTGMRPCAFAESKPLTFTQRRSFKFASGARQVPLPRSSGEVLWHNQSQC